jgi:uridine kinase
MRARTAVGAPRPGCYLVGIAGASCSGKSALASRLVPALEPLSATVIALDDYYHDLSALPAEQSERRNFDVPGAIDVDLLERHLKCLAEGLKIDKPVYRFETHTRATWTECVSPTRVVILEGLFALYWPSIRNLMGTKAFVAVSDATSLCRRMSRDVRERGRSADGARRQYEDQVLPMYERHVLPTRAHADLVVSGEGALEVSAAIVVKHILDNLQGTLASGKSTG